MREFNYEIRDSISLRMKKDNKYYHTSCTNKYNQIVQIFASSFVE